MPPNHFREESLNVLIVTESYPPVSYGGGEISCALFAEALVEREDIEVTVLTSQIEDEKRVEKRNGVEVLRHLKTGRDRESFKENLKRRLFFKRSVKKEIKKIHEEYDLIHFFNITSITALSIDVPTFATINSYLNFCPKGNLFYKEQEACEGCSFLKFVGCLTNSEFIGNYQINKLLKYNPFFWSALYFDYKKRNKSLKSVDHFFGLSEYINELLIDNRVEEKDIEKVVNIPDIEKLESSGEIQLNLETRDDIPTIAYIGVLSKIKGVDLLIKAFQKAESEAELLIVGDGPKRQELEQLAEQVDKEITFLGHLDHEDIPAVYKKSDFVVLPSVWPEPLSRILLESAFFGKPVLATDLGGSSEIIKHGYNGLLFEPEVGDLKEKLEIIIEEEDKRKEYSENMEEFFKNELDKEVILDDIVGFYKEKVSKK